MTPEEPGRGPGDEGTQEGAPGCSGGHGDATRGDGGRRRAMGGTGVGRGGEGTQDAGETIGPCHGGIQGAGRAVRDSVAAGHTEGKMNLHGRESIWGVWMVPCSVFHLTSFFFLVQGPPGCLEQKEGAGSWVSTRPSPGHGQPPSQGRGLSGSIPLQPVPLWVLRIYFTDTDTNAPTGGSPGSAP